MNAPQCDQQRIPLYGKEIEPKLTVCYLYLVAKGWVDIDIRYSVFEKSKLMIVFKLDERV
jgi:hypothetical protein